MQRLEISPLPAYQHLPLDSASVDNLLFLSSGVLCELVGCGGSAGVFTCCCGVLSFFYRRPENLENGKLTPAEVGIIALHDSLKLSPNLYLTCHDPATDMPSGSRLSDGATGDQPLATPDTSRSGTIPVLNSFISVLAWLLVCLNTGFEKCGKRHALVFVDSWKRRVPRRQRVRYPGSVGPAGSAGTSVARRPSTSCTPPPCPALSLRNSVGKKSNQRLLNMELSTALIN